MPSHRVVVHCMHERELASARDLMPDADYGEGIVVGELDDARIARLEAQNILVQRLDVRPPDPLWAVPRRDLAPSEEGRRVAVPTEYPPHVPIQYRVSVKGPLLAHGRWMLESAGVRILEAHPDFNLRVLMSGFVASGVKELSFVMGVAPWEEEQGGRQAELVPEPDLAAEPGAVAFDVLLVHPLVHDAVRDWLSDHDIPIDADSADGFRIRLLPDSPQASELREQIQWILRVERYVPPTLHNDVARALIGVEPSLRPPPAELALEGEGQIIGVADTGIDATHPDLQGRLAAVIPLGRAGDASDPDGHGTHVTGSIAGDGAASEGTLRGIAPKATIVFQSLLDARSNGLGGLPFRLEGLFQQAYDLGVRIHNDSWGCDTGSSYRLNSGDVDAYVHAHRDMLIVLSAGNAGTSVEPDLGMRRTRKGYVNWLSICSPATAKNGLTVGASRSSRTSGGYAERTYGAWNRFPDDPIRGETVSGDPERIMGFSSRGPCDNYRIKPDVVAPGTDILSCRSSLAPDENFWGPGPSAAYAYRGGTSMAAPLVTGCAALVREYYLKRRQHEPSAALLKATLVNGTRQLTGEDAVADFPYLPNYHQGFGCISMPDTIPNAARPRLALEFVDNWKEPGKHLQPGARRRYFVKLEEQGELRVCLAYTDPPGPGILNNLDLLVELPGGAVKLYGNMRLPNGLGVTDATNNVEIVRIPAAAAGRYLIMVQATNILWAPQDFALVATGPFAEPIVEVPGGGA